VLVLAEKSSEAIDEKDVEWPSIGLFETHSEHVEHESRIEPLNAFLLVYLLHRGYC